MILLLVRHNKAVRLYGCLYVTANPVLSKKFFSVLNLIPYELSVLSVQSRIFSSKREVFGRQAERTGEDWERKPGSKDCNYRNSERDRGNIKFLMSIAWEKISCVWRLTWFFATAGVYYMFSWHSHGEIGKGPVWGMWPCECMLEVCSWILEGGSSKERKTIMSYMQGCATKKIFITSSSDLFLAKRWVDGLTSPRTSSNLRCIMMYLVDSSLSLISHCAIFSSTRHLAIVGLVLLRAHLHLDLPSLHTAFLVENYPNLFPFTDWCAGLKWHNGVSKGSFVNAWMYIIRVCLAAIVYFRRSLDERRGVVRGHRWNEFPRLYLKEDSCHFFCQWIALWEQIIGAVVLMRLHIHKYSRFRCACMRGKRVLPRSTKMHRHCTHSLHGNDKLPCAELL